MYAYERDFDCVSGLTDETHMHGMHVVTDCKQGRREKRLWGSGCRRGSRVSKRMDARNVNHSPLSGIFAYLLYLLFTSLLRRHVTPTRTDLTDIYIRTMPTSPALSPTDNPSSSSLPSTDNMPTVFSPPSSHHVPPPRPSHLSHAVSSDRQSNSRRVSLATPDISSARPSSCMNSRVNDQAQKSKVLGLQDRLRNEVDGVVKRRSGGVLGRG